MLINIMRLQYRIQNKANIIIINIAEQQYGFRSNHSTEYAAVKLVNYISNKMDDHKIPGTIFIDLSNVFDTLSYDI